MKNPDDAVSASIIATLFNTIASASTISFSLGSRTYRMEQSADQRIWILIGFETGGKNPFLTMKV